MDYQFKLANSVFFFFLFNYINSLYKIYIFISRRFTGICNFFFYINLLKDITLCPSILS
jgi:hypothetical protein